jgi:acyl transferase domain-containing protein/3-hydroxymyristoyl/3-hydroxydecanoyl-(acyl carrier protein) dehydratase
MMPTGSEPIAIVGRGCVLPGALTPDAFWDNVLAGRVSLTRVDDDRWRLPVPEVLGEPGHAERALTDVGGYVREFDTVFDPTGYLLEPDEIRALDPLFHWVLHGARAALQEADQNQLLPRAGMVLGNLSFPSTGMADYAEHVWLSTAGEHAAGPRPHARNRFMSGLPAILGARGLGLGLGGYAIDAACASSLYAIKLACDQLHTGAADLMIAGGVNRADDLFLHISFTTLSALSRTGSSRPFHQAADGLVPAEGAGFLALMRLSDAVRAGARIFGLIRGVGLSNDGGAAGPLVPSAAGQERAMRQAYEQAGVSPESIGLLECHATGTRLGDITEVRSSGRVFADHPDLPIGSVKSNIGHAITAAGLAGVLKVLGALNTGIRPPSLGADEPMSALDGTPLRVLSEAEEWTGPHRAGISAFGFGGNNAHLIIEAWQADRTAPAPVPVRRCSPIAIVSAEVRSAADDARSALFTGSPRLAPRTDIDVAIAGLRFPPTDLQHTSGQQVLMLETARSAAKAVTLPRDRTMVLTGMGCDPDAARHIARWRAPESVRDGVHTAQVPASVLGTMPNMVANRINTQLDLAGPSFSVSAEEASGLTALRLGVSALRHHEADAVVVGAVDLSHEPVHQAALADVGHDAAAGDVAVALVLKRLDDARAQGDHVLALIDDNDDNDSEESTITVGDPLTSGNEHLDPGKLFGRAHAASGLLAVAVAALALHARALPRVDASAAPMLQDSPTALASINTLDGAPAEIRLRGADARGFLAQRVERPYVYSGQDRTEVLEALAQRRQSREGPARLVVLATDDDQWTQRARAARRWLTDGGSKPDGVAFRDSPIEGEIAFVYSGGSMAYPGMGRALMLALPALLDPIRQRCGDLRRMVGWAYQDNAEPSTALEQIWGASLLGQFHTEIARMLGIQPDAALGYSSGESTSLAALGVWPDVTALLRQAQESPLFSRDLVGELAALRPSWQRHGVDGTGWRSYLAEAPVDMVRSVLADEPVVHLMVINAPDSCVFGGEARNCARVARALDEAGARTLQIPYEIAAHVPEIAGVHHERWRELHLVPTNPAPDVRFYTCVDQSWYRPTAETAADVITRQSLGMIDFAGTVRRAWADGVRVFVQLGPRNLAATWIDRTLGEREHLAVAFDDPREVSQLARAVAELLAAGVPMQTDALFDHLVGVGPAEQVDGGPTVSVPAHLPAVELGAVLPPAPWLAEDQVLSEPNIAAPAAETGTRHGAPIVAAVAKQHERATAAYQQFLAIQGESQQRFLATQRTALAVLNRMRMVSGDPPPANAAAVALPTPVEEPRGGTVFDRAELEHLATGPISTLFGPQFQPQDAYPRQTRLPAPPMLLVDRVTEIKAQPGSMGVGSIRTETDVPLDAWYLDPCGRMPAGITVESGQADLLLISWLGVDLLNRGERVYRLLGCDVTFHGQLPQPGDTLRYEIHIDGHGEHGGVRIFFFRYDCYVGDDLRLSMRQGQAGFFTDDELRRSAGVLWDPAEETPDPNCPLDPVEAEARGFDADQVSAFCAGQPVDCFGPDWEFTRTHVRTPRISDGRMRLLHEVEVFDPTGGPWGRGYLRAVTPIASDDWFFDGHFVNDPCMPGTLMFEGCVQAMSFYLAAAGLTVRRDGWRFEPVSETAYHMVCRGQVTPESTSVTYEVFVSELSAEPMPTLYADVLCTVDDVKAFHVRRLGVRLVPDWPLTHWRQLGPRRELTSGAPVPLRKLAGLHGHVETQPVAEVDGFRYDYAAMLACAWGKPSEAFGPAYARFDGPRRLARLPGPPYHFMSRVVEVAGPPWIMQPGSRVVVDYDVPEEVWYFQQNSFPTMPFGVLMEVVLQASGWLASYVGSALTQESDLLFRNLDGTGTVKAEILPNTRLLRTSTELVDVARSGDLIIQTFQVECLADGAPAFSLRTVFGFFPTSTFDNQIGLPPSDDERAVLAASSSFEVDLRATPDKYFGGALRMPGPMLLMVDRVTGYWPEAGAAGLGRLRAEKDITADEWFFRAHFFQDPVQPGSLGVQALCQLLEFYAIERQLGAVLRRPRFQPVLLDRPVQWKYRGQVVPENRKVLLEVEILGVERHPGEVRILAEGWLWADDKRIYHIQQFGIAVVADAA